MWQPSSTTQRAVTHRLPRKTFIPGVRTASTRDHNGHDVRIAWMAREEYEGYTEKLPPFPFQVYILTSAKKTTNDPDFVTDFVKWVEQVCSIDSPDGHTHFQFYSNGFSDILACTDHQRREVQSRNRNAIWPRLVSSWADPRFEELGYEGFILVIDRDHWKTNGLVAVDFDAHRSDGSYMPSGHEIVLRAERAYDVEHIKELLTEAWERAGDAWAQLRLERHNSGGFSPALYPAVDPSAHYDAEHEDQDDSAVASTTGESQPEPTDLDHSDSRQSDITMRDLLRSPQDLPGLKRITYEGHAGWETTSIWKSSLSKSRPPFTFTLYIASDTLPFSAESLFACLDRGLVHNAPWTLDVVRNVPDMRSALHHYKHEAHYRSAERTERRLKWARMMLGKICGPELPEELLQLIEDLLVQPACPDYSAPPLRAFRNMFLFLDASTQLTGPRMIYSNHFLDLPRTDNDEGHTNSSELPSWYPAEEVMKLVVTDLQSWARVSDELHTTWSFCSPRLELPQEALPWFSLRLSFPQFCVIDIGARDLEQQKPHASASLKLHGTGPITIQNPSILFFDLWEAGVKIFDVEDDTKVPARCSFLPLVEFQRLSSWSEDPTIAYKSPEGGLTGPRLQTIWPEKDETISSSFAELPHRYWWDRNYDSGFLKDSHEYIVRIKKDLKVTNWTYGSLPGLKGPYNLPPIPVYGENECRFRFKTTDIGSETGDAGK